MSDLDWEPRRVPIERAGAGDGPARRRAGPVGQYVGLEFPRESVTWVVRGGRTRSVERPTLAKSKLARLGERLGLGSIG